MNYVNDSFLSFSFCDDGYSVFSADKRFIAAVCCVENDFTFVKSPYPKMTSAVVLSPDDIFWSSASNWYLEHNMFRLVVANVQWKGTGEGCWNYIVLEPFQFTSLKSSQAFKQFSLRWTFQVANL